MGTRGRKSAAELGVIPGIPQRPEPPDELTPQQAEEWREIVDRMPVDWFRRKIHPLLCSYCRHVTNARHIAGLIEAAHDLDIGDRKALMRFNRLLGMQERQSSALMGLATRNAADKPVALHGQLCGHGGKGRHHRQAAMGNLTLTEQITQPRCG